MTSIVLVASLTAQPWACGDKVLVPGRGARFKGKVDRAATRVLVYARPGSEFEAAFRNLSAERGLRAAGYRPTVAASHSELEDALRGGGWDVVIVDLEDSRGIGASGTEGPGPVVLPVAGSLSKATVDAARRQYGLVLNVPRGQQALVLAIDHAVTERARGRSRPPRG
jgi:hypothetical protein